MLKKLLNDELKVRAKKNSAKQIPDEDAKDGDQEIPEKILTVAEVTDELIKLSKEIVASDNEAKNLGLTDFEYAFHTAVAGNDGAKALMQKNQLRELAVALTHRARNNPSIDWTVKESARAKLKIIVKRTLRQFGYPPDMQLLAAETVLKKRIADGLAETARPIFGR